jgi:hypothetical protein
MSQTDRTPHSLDALFHPVSHYGSPEDVLRDAARSATEKRVILSSWASDIYAVESNPTLRKIPGIEREMHLADILSALRRLDEDDHPPRPGGATMRLPPYTRVQMDGLALHDLAGRRMAAKRFPSIALKQSRWSREANIRRYRTLLRTPLMPHERRFVEQRLAEELGA